MTLTPNRLKQLAGKISSSNMQIPVEANKIYRAKVVDVKDPNKRGAVKVWIADLMYNSVPENQGLWAMPGNTVFTSNKENTDPGGQDSGSLIIPPKNSYVWVIFEDGDFNRARYMGGISMDVDESVPTENQSGSQYYNKWTLLKTPKGRQVFLSDDPDDESIIIRGKIKDRSARNKTGDPRQPLNSMQLELWEAGGKEYAVLSDGTGQYFLLDAAGERVRIQHVSGSYIEFTAGGDIVIQAQNNVWINSHGASKQAFA